jgi:glucan phosphoethanolaminetransferase (alkaline phosphatase superfamily)
MAIFDFGRKQRLHTQLVGNTSGREMFKVDEYNSVKRLTFLLGFVMVVIFTIFYFCWASIPKNIKIFMILIFIGCGIWEYFNIKHQIRVKESLYC